MNKNEYKRKIDNSYMEGKTKCKCGHTEVMLPSTESCICSYCGSKVKNKSIARFRFMYYKAKEKKNETI